VPLDGLYPSYVKIYYTSAYAPHTMTLPTRQWTGAAGTPGEYEAWDASSIAGDTMIEALITAMLPNNLATTAFNSYEIFDVPVMGEPAVWKYGKYVSGQVGTLVNTGSARSNQYTMTFKCTDGNLLKVVNLDTPVGNSWGNVIGLSARDEDISIEILAATNAWQGRQGGQPIAFSNITISQNKRLRRKYDMI